MGAGGGGDVVGFLMGEGYSESIVYLRHTVHPTFHPVNPDPLVCRSRYTEGCCTNGMVLLPQHRHAIGLSNEKYPAKLPSSPRAGVYVTYG